MNGNGTGRAGVLAGRVAVVTGAASGIGLAIAERLAASGAVIVLADLAEDPLRAAEARVVAAGGQDVMISVGDLSREEAANRLIHQTVARFDKIDILVNNAGGGVIRPFLSHTAETLKATIDRNLWTAIWCCRAALPAMVEREYGRIVNVGADSVRNGLWDHAAYNAAKGGLHGLTTGLAREFATRGITINTVAPCAVETPRLDELRPTHPELVERLLGIIPMGRPAEMSEVASMVHYLALGEASFVTGQVISVNGGATML